MTTTTKTFRNFLVANLCALVPLWVVACGWMPDQVKVFVRGTAAEPVSIVSEGITILGEHYGNWADGPIWRFYLQEGMEWKNLAFRLPGNSDAGTVARIELQKWKLLSLGKPGTELENTGTGFRYPRPRFERVGFASNTVGMGLAGLEGLLLLLSWFFARRHREERWRTLLPSVLGISLALTLLMQVALPFQSYIANRSSFPFPLSALCGVVAVRFALLFAWNTLAMFLLAHCFGRWVLAPVFAFTTCAYLESGILEEGLPSLNGDWTFFADRFRARWDATVWGGGGALAFAAHRWLKSWYGVAGLGMTVMLAASMLDVKPERKADTSDLIVRDFSSIETVLRSVAYSTNRNVMVFVIDSLEREQAHAIMEDPEVGPELHEQFCGFTEFTNNVGACDASLPAIPNLFTGQYPEYQWGKQADEFYQSVYATESVLADYLASGKTVFVGTPSLGYGYTNHKYVDDVVVSNARSPWMLPSNGEGVWSLDAVVRFRWIPFVGKSFFARLFSLTQSGKIDSNREWNLYPLLSAARVDGNGTDTFLFVHTSGVHVPVLYNRNGELLAQEESTDAGCIEMGICVLRELGRLFDAYRANGVYDNSLILVLADHGHHGYRGRFSSNEEAVLPGNARPFLWVKPVESNQPFSSSPLPTSHARISDLLKAANRQDVSQELVETILQSDERIYRTHKGKDWEDWHVQKDGRANIVVVPARELEAHAMKAVKIGQWVPLSRNVRGGDESPDVQLNNLFPSDGDTQAQLVWYPNANTMALGIKAPHGQRYLVRLRLHVWNTLETGVNALGSKAFLDVQSQKAEIAGEGTQEVILSVPGPDDDGLIWIHGKREDGFNSKIAFTHLCLEEADNRTP